MSKIESAVAQVVLLIVIISVAAAGHFLIASYFGFDSYSLTGFVFMWIWWPFWIWLLARTGGIEAHTRPDPPADLREHSEDALMQRIAEHGRKGDLFDRIEREVSKPDH